MTKFQFKKKWLEYFIHEYNNTGENERKIEIPLVLNYMEGFLNYKILEIGNVLSHYKPIKHDVIDLNEKDEFVTYNEDIINFKSEKNYDLTISISTIEHTSNPYFAVQKIGSLAKKSIITVPLGINITTEMLIHRKLGYGLYYFEKQGDNWHQVNIIPISRIKYDNPEVTELMIMIK